MTGLDVTTEVETLREGGLNHGAHKLPKATSYSDLVLVQGVTDFDMMWGWYEDVVDGNVKRRNGTIYLLNQVGVPAMYWNFVDAYPIQWKGPQFDAATGAVVTQTLTLTHEGLTRPLSSKVLSAAQGVVSGGIDVAQKFSIGSQATAAIGGALSKGITVARRY